MVTRLPSMVDMSKSKEELQKDLPSLGGDQPIYPYGLCISLCQDELDKLDMDTEDVQIGDMIHLMCMAKVTSISEQDNEISGPSCRLELQITHISAEDEDTEEEDEKTSHKDKMSKLYGK